MNHRPAKLRRVSRRRRRRPHLLLGFSSFVRSLSLASLYPKSLPPRECRSPLPSKSILKSPTTKHPPPVNRPSSSSDDDDNDQDGDVEQDVEMIQADFGFFDPKPGDFNGVKLLLRNYLDDNEWDLTGFVDIILEQTTVGTIVKPDGDDHDDENENDDDGDDGLFAVISALNLGRYAGHTCIGELKEFLLEACVDENAKKKLRTLLEERASQVGLLVSQRFVNCPHQLVPPLYDALFDEVSWAIEDEPTQELQDSFRFKYYLLLTRIHVQTQNKNVKQKKAMVNRDHDEPIIYVKAEDEIFRELSSFSFTFSLFSQQLAPHELRNYKTMGLVMVVNADEVPKFRERLKSFLAES